MTDARLDHLDEVYSNFQNIDSLAYGFAFCVVEGAEGDTYAIRDFSGHLFFVFLRWKNEERTAFRVNIRREGERVTVLHTCTVQEFEEVFSQQFYS